MGVVPGMVEISKDCYFQFDFYITGTSNGFLWQRYSGSTFKYVKNNYAHRTSSVLVTDSFMVRVYSKEDLSKVLYLHSLSVMFYLVVILN